MSDSVGIWVQPEAVAAVGDAIDGALSGVDASGPAGVSAAAVGHAGLATALADFADEWGRGVRQLVGDGQRFSVELHATVAEYQRGEDEVRRSFSGSGD